MSEHERIEQVKCLMEQGFPRGLANSLFRYSKDAFALRLWVVDNSGSMITSDGRKLVATRKKNDIKWVACSRWEELKECVMYHAQLTALLDCPTKFNLLNSQRDDIPHSFGVAEMGPDMVEEELVSLANALSEVHPSGTTPLERHLNEIYAAIAPMAASLEQSGKKVVVCLATDGIPTDDRGYQNDATKYRFERALQRLMQELPVWVVVRLCTSEERVLQFYQDIDTQLECNIEVLDDYLDEAKEVFRFNPWITYGLPLHRCREMGFQHRLLDLVDERTLTLDEVLTFLRLLFDKELVCDPHVDWDGFLKEIKMKILSGEGLTYNPGRKRLTPWLDLNKLKQIYGPTKLHLNWYFATLLVFCAVFIQLLTKYIM
mmetsp:Transcript_1572/g.2156  ORF Transcript_1572/g.2156 Transcript_1572/m.2156 type:complete len:374 (-) Transcript_1572:598-1719(-)